MEFRRHNCTYCGDLSDTLDHVFPYSRSGMKAKSYRKSFVVPCCRECNSSLGNNGNSPNGDFTIASKAEYLELHYQNKYRKFIEGNYGDFNKSETDTHRGFLKKIIQQDRRTRQHLKRRLEHLELVREKSPTIYDVWDSIDTNRCSLQKDEVEISYLGATFIITDAENLNDEDIQKIANDLRCNYADLYNAINGISTSGLSIRHN